MGESSSPPVRAGAPVRLDRFDNSWYRAGRGTLVRTAWFLVSMAFFRTAFPWPSRLKAVILRGFGARVGRGVVLRHRLNIKYPWHLEIGDHAWVGEGVWLDSLTTIHIGSHACLSQGAMVETGNHDWSDPAFGLQVGEVSIGTGAWVAARALLLPGSRLGDASVLTAGSVLAGEAVPFGIYQGNPARRIKERELRETS